MSVRSIRLRSGAPERHTLAPGQLAYFHVDIPRGRRCTLLHLRMEKAGGDPVLMASANQWPVVDLEDADDMVRAHCCAFEAFEDDAALHVLTIPDAGAHAPPAHPSAATPGGFPALPAGVAVRWAVGVFNFDLVKREACALTLEAHVGALDGRAPAPAARSPRRALTSAASTHTPPRALGSPRPLAPAPPTRGCAGRRRRSRRRRRRRRRQTRRRLLLVAVGAPDRRRRWPRRGASSPPLVPAAAGRLSAAASSCPAAAAAYNEPTHDENGRRIDHATPATQVAAAPGGRGRRVAGSVRRAAAHRAAGRARLGGTRGGACHGDASHCVRRFVQRCRRRRRDRRGVRTEQTGAARRGAAAAPAEASGNERGLKTALRWTRAGLAAASSEAAAAAAQSAEAIAKSDEAGRRAEKRAELAERAARENFGAAAAAEAAATGTKAALRWTRAAAATAASARAGAEAAAARAGAAVAEQAAAAEAAAAAARAALKEAGADSAKREAALKRRVKELEVGAEESRRRESALIVDLDAAEHRAAEAEVAKEAAEAAAEAAAAATAEVEARLATVEEELAAGARASRTRSLWASATAAAASTPGRAPSASSASVVAGTLGRAPSVGWVGGERAVRPVGRAPLGRRGRGRLGAAVLKSLVFPFGAGWSADRALARALAAWQRGVRAVAEDLDATGFHAERRLWAVMAAEARDGRGGGAYSTRNRSKGSARRPRWWRKIIGRRWRRRRRGRRRRRRVWWKPTTKLRQRGRRLRRHWRR